MPAIARAPNCRHRPTWVAGRVRIRTTRRRDHDPAPLSPHQVADEVIRKLIAPLSGHDVRGPQWAAAAPYLCSCVHAADHTFDLASVGHRPEIMKMTRPYSPAIVTVRRNISLFALTTGCRWPSSSSPRIGTTFYSPNHLSCASPMDGLFTWLSPIEQEVCGSWAGRKRLVAVCSGEGAVGVVRVMLRQWRTGKRVNGDKWGHGDVGGDGRDAGLPRRMVRPWRISTRKPKRAKRVREAQARANEARQERERHNVDDAASFLVELGRLAAVDEWEQARVVEIHAEGERRRHEHRQEGAAAVSRMQERGETLTAIAELAGVKVSDVRAVLKSAGAQPIVAPDARGARGGASDAASAAPDGRGRGALGDAPKL